MKSINEQPWRARLSRALLWVDTITNVLACLINGIIGLNQESLTLLAAFAHPLATIGIRGYARSWKAQAQKGQQYESRRRVLKYGLLLACGIVPFVYHMATTGAHGVLRPRSVQYFGLIGGAMAMLMASIPGLVATRLSLFGERANWKDTLLGVSAAIVCFLSAAFAMAWPSFWLLDGLTAIVVFGLWEARLILWLTARVYNA